MKIVSSSDWRDAIAFDVPVVVADVVPGEPTRCVGCGADGELFDRTELWAVKHRHPNQHAGYVRFYCLEHRPAAAAPPVAASAGRRSAQGTRAKSAPRTAPARRPAVSEEPRAMCPDCFVEVSATGMCGMCGTQVA